MTDFFLFRDESIDWDQSAELAEILTGQVWADEGETQEGRIPVRIARALAAVRDDQQTELAPAWCVRLGAGFSAESLQRDLDGLRAQARAAIERRGALWLRIEP